MAKKQKVTSGKNPKTSEKTPLELAHEQRSAESARVRKLSPTQRTIELAPRIVSKAVKAVRKVGVLGAAKIEGAPKYALTTEQKERILSTLRYEVDQLDGRLNPGERKNKGGSEFSF